jgi:diacylglycerol kinase (ATP)
MRALLVHNPTAGTKGHDKDSIIEALRLADFKVDYVSTKEPGAESALAKAGDIVVAAGGDGTIAFVFTHLNDHSVPIGVIPLGSANNIARSLGIAGTPQELTEQWRIDHVRKFNLIRLDGLGEKLECAEAFGVGAIPQLIKRRAKGKKAGAAEDIRRGRSALAKILGEADKLDVEVIVDGKSWGGEMIALDILNIPFTGPALPLAHDADPADRLLDVIGIESGRAEEFAEWMKDPQDHPPPVIACQGTRVELRWRNVESRVDDELFRAKPDWQDVAASCDGDPLNILIPVRHPAVKSNADAPGSRRLESRG